MATLFNTKISATYKGLLKTIDNAAISATLRELTDGSGNQSGLYLNTAGDFKVTNVLEWGSLKDTGTGVTITQFVTSTDGIENFNNNTTLPTSAAVKLYVDTKFSQTDTLTEVLGFGNTTSGKDIIVSAGDDITFTDSSKILMGASADLEIYHDGSHSYIKDAGTGNLRIWGSTLQIQNWGTGAQMAKFVAGAQVELNYDGAKKFETTLLGSTVTGDLLVTGTITGAGGSFLPLAGGTMTGNIVLNDNVKSIYGTANDGLEIYHDGTDSYINDTGTGGLIIRAANNIKLQTNTAELYLQGIKDGAVKLYYDNSEKLLTSSTGVNITGALSTTTNVSVGANATFVDNGKAQFGTSNDLQIYHDGSDSYIKEIGTGTLRFQSNGGAIDFYKDSTEFLARFKTDSGIELYFDGTKRLETLTDGAKVTGNLEVTGTITGAGGSFLPLIGGTMTGDTIHNDNVKSIYGTASDGLEVYHDGSHSYLKDSGTGDLKISSNTVRIESDGAENMIIASANGAVNLYYNNNQKLATTNGGISVTGNGVFTENIYIETNKKLFLGDSSNFQLFYDGTNGRVINNTGDLYIDQSAVTQSIVFRVSDANALDTTALTISRNGDLITGRDVTIAGDLTVNGTTTTVNSQTLSVDDPLISLAINNAANSLDIGYYGKYNDGTTRYLGLYNDASDSNKFKLFKGTTVEPTTTVDIGAAGYAAADLELANLVATGGNFSGNINLSNTSALAIGTSYLYRINGSTMGLFGNLSTSGSATFAGNVVTTGTSFIGKASTSSYVPDDGVFGGIITNGGGFKITTQAIDTMTLSAVGGNMTVRGGGTFGGNVSITGQINANTGSILRGSEGLYLSAGGDTANGRELQFTSSANGGSAGAKHTINARSGNGMISLATSGTTALTVDESQNVGIGTDSPSAKLHVDDSAGGILRLSDTLATSDGEKIGGIETGVANGTFLAGINFFRHDQNDGEIRFRTKVNNTNADVMTIVDGNVGIGTASPSAKLDVVSGGGIHISDDALGRTLIIKPSLTGQVHEFTSDNTSAGYSFSNNSSELMRISNTGKLGIGTNSPSAKLHVDNSGVANTAVRIDAGAVADAIVAYGNGGKKYFQLGEVGATDPATMSLFNNEVETIRLKTNGKSFFNAGNVGIGTDSPQTKLHLYDNTATVGLSIQADNASSSDVNFGDEDDINIGRIKYEHSTDSMQFQTNNAERMRITNGGNVLIGTTAVVSSSQGGAEFLAGESGGRRILRLATTNTSVNDLVVFINGNGTVGTIRTNGSATSYNTSSDYRLKEDLKDFAGLDMVSKIPVYDFKWKTDESRSYGVMAHELQEVLPDAVSGEKDAEEMQGVDYSKIVPLLIKSIQEQQVMLKQLKAEIDILKAK